MQTNIYSFIDSMEKIERDIKNCKKCRLWKNRNNPVPGEGGNKRSVMFIGEAPGKWEDIKGRPFVGAAGKYLDELLSSIGLTREDVYITNIVKCRPPGNRDPRDDEIEKCVPYLDRQISVLKPKIICPLGRFSSRYILNKFGFEMSSISRVQGTVFKGDIIIIPMYHPAAALYHGEWKADLQKAFYLLRDVLKELGLERNCR